VCDEKSRFVFFHRTRCFQRRHFSYRENVMWNSQKFWNYFWGNLFQRST